MRLYEDFNDDGIADGAAVRSVFSAGDGTWSMAVLPVGNYILEQANGTTATVSSILDDGVLEPIIDPLTPATPVGDPLNTAVKIPVRPLAVNGNINIIINI